MAQHAEVDLPGFYNSEKAREALGGGKMSGATAVFRINANLEKCYRCTHFGVLPL